MALESAVYISDLVIANPVSGDGPLYMQDHLRMLKAVLKASFPNVSDAVTASDVELNIADGLTVTTAELNKMAGVTVTAAEIEYADALTSAVQTQISGKEATRAFETKTAAFTAVADYAYVCRARTAYTVTIPSSATAGQIIELYCTPDTVSNVNYSGRFNGSFQGVSLSVGGAVRLVYVDSTTGWARHQA